VNEEPASAPSSGEGSVEPADDGGRDAPRRPRPGDDGPVVPDRAAEDRPEAWGERADEDDDERYLRERPPHW